MKLATSLHARTMQSDHRRRTLSSTFNLIFQLTLYLVQLMVGDTRDCKTKYSDYKYREYRTTFDPHGLGSYVTSQGRKDVAGRKHAPAESRVARVHPIHSSSSSTGLAGKIGTSRECGFAHPLNVSRFTLFRSPGSPPF